jgi:cation:H+ antiporter
MNEYLWTAAGFGLLILGAEALVRGSVAVARRAQVSPLLIGVTIVAYGTSMPELVVSVDASLSGNYGIAVGNVVGSNIFNILLILGLTAFLAPIAVSGRAIGRDGLFALAAAGLFIWIVLQRPDNPALGFNDGVLFLAVLVSMALFSFGHERGRTLAERSRFMRARQPTYSAVVDLGLVGVGIALLIFGADVLVKNAVVIAQKNQVSEAVIGLTLVAAGTSLPELVTSVVAALRRQSDIALGNVVGSNIYNILAILGVASVIGPVHVDQQIVRIDMWVMLAATLALFVPMLFANRLGRGYGLLLLIGYAAYVGYLFQNAGLVDLGLPLR